MLAFIVILLIVGLIAGAIARLVVPGRDQMSLLATLGLGIVGSFVGGFLQNLVFLHTVSLFALHPAGVLGSIIGSIIVLLISPIFVRRRHPDFWSQRERQGGPARPATGLARQPVAGRGAKKRAQERTRHLRQTIMALSWGTRTRT